MAAAGDVLLEIGERDDMPIGAGGADDEIGLDESLVQFVPRRGLAIPFGGQRFGAREIAIEDDDLAAHRRRVR